jgi:acetolactate synthase I/II/III large subunit
MSRTVADAIVACLKQEGVEVIFGIPGEENIRLVMALEGSGIRFILTRHEQAAAFMADMYGRLTGRAGVCTATLGPGAINLLLGVADATTDSTPLVALTAQVGLDRIYRESHQSVDLVAMFRPVTKWADIVLTPQSVPEMVRKAFSLACSERPGATYLAIPQDIEAAPAPPGCTPLRATPSHDPGPDGGRIAEAATRLKTARRPVILAGHGVARARASDVLARLSEALNAPVATTFMGKGVIPDDHPNALGVIGFMAHDYENFAFDQADLIMGVGYELQEFSPARINPDHDKSIIHLHCFAPDIDAAWQPDISIESDIVDAIDALLAALGPRHVPPNRVEPLIRSLRAHELRKGEEDDSFPLKPQRIVADIRAVLEADDIVLADTGAVKMWMARLYPTQAPLTCLMSNGLSTMAFSLPGAIGAALACPGKRVLATMGDGSFLMNSQEIETAIRENIPLKVLIWEDGSYGLIKWKMDMELHRHAHVDFTNPDFVAYAHSFGANGYRITSAADLRPTLEKALAEPGVSIMTVAVDYSENMKLIDRLGDLTIAL